MALMFDRKGSREVFHFLQSRFRPAANDKADEGFARRGGGMAFESKLPAQKRK